MATEAGHDAEATPFDPRQRRTPRRPVGGPPPKDLLAVLEPVPEQDGAPEGEEPAEETADGGRLPGRQRRPGSREIHVTLSERAYRLLEAVRGEQPGTSYGDLIVAALREAKPTLVAERPSPPEDPLLRPARSQRLHVEGRTRSRPFNVTPAQADAIRALADEVGIPNLSELVDRSVVLTYSAAGDGDHH
jgi:hypothetical protein